MNTKVINLLQLYPFEMNIYGDWGNVLVLTKRLQWRGFTVNLLQHHPGAHFPADVDLIVGGGGQDSGQSNIEHDLQTIAPHLHKLADDGVPMLMVCGLYQLFGHYFQTGDGQKIKGIGLFDAYTVAGPTRLISNVVVKSEFGEIIGYENHSGLTQLGSRSHQPALGTVTKGNGNNGRDKSEGATYKNVIGTYLHGSLLPKNPQLADHLIAQAVIKKYGEFTPRSIDDSLAEQARRSAIKRPR